jgi:hypothetical protein
VVWVNNDRMYFNSKEFEVIPKEEWEASPYASVYKYSHDVFPAKAGLGANGCTDCHAFNSDFFFAETLKYPFDENGQPVTSPQYKQLGISAYVANTGAFRESLVKPVVYFGMAALVIFLLAFGVISVLVKNNIISAKQQNLLSWVISVAVLAAGIFGWFAGDLGNYMFPTRMFLDANHFILSMAVMFAAVLFYLKFDLASARKWKLNLLAFLIQAVVFSGIFMLLKLGSLAYTVFDLSLVGILAICIAYAEKLFNLKIEENA